LFQGPRGFHTEKAVSTPRFRLFRSPTLLAFGITCWLALAGCSAAAAVQNVKAAAAVERAREAGTAKTAPYEFAAAQAYLAKAREEASEAQYLDAIRFAKAAQQSADKAVEVGNTQPGASQ
jgi:hypothetical protein